MPGLATRWEADTSGAVYTFHLRTDATFHDGRPISRPHGARPPSAARSPSRPRARAPGRSLPIRGAAAFAAGEAGDVEGIAVPDDSTIVFTLEEPLNIFPKLLAMPAAAIVPDAGGPDFERAPGRQRALAVRRLVARRRARPRGRNEGYWGGRPASDTLRIRIIPEPLTQAAEYEFGQLSVVEIPFSETPRWEQEHGPRAAAPSGDPRRSTSPSTPRAGRSRTCACAARSTWRWTPGRCCGPSWRAAASARPAPSRPASRATTPPARRIPTTPRPRAALLAEAGYADGLTLKLWRTQRAELARIAQAMQQSLAQVGVTVEIVERDASSARAAVAKGEADLFLTDWYADYPDPENFTYPLFHSRNAGGGGNYAFLRGPGHRPDDHARPRHRPTRREKDSLSRAIDAAGLRRWRPGSSSGFPWTSGPSAPT